MGAGCYKSQAKIEDVVEIQVERGKKCASDNLVVAGLFNWFLDLSCGGGWVDVENDINANSAFN